ncbi:serine/threonine-protein kinase WNK2 [Ixodes scapularis]
MWQPSNPVLFLLQIVAWHALPVDYDDSTVLPRYQTLLKAPFPVIRNASRGCQDCWPLDYQNFSPECSPVFGGTESSSATLKSSQDAPLFGACFVSGRGSYATMWQPSNPVLFLLQIVAWHALPVDYDDSTVLPRYQTLLKAPFPVIRNASRGCQDCWPLDYQNFSPECSPVFGGTESSSATLKSSQDAPLFGACFVSGRGSYATMWQPSNPVLFLLQVPKKQKRDVPKVPNSGKGKVPQPAKPEERMNPLQSQLEEENAALRAELVVMQGEFLAERQLTRRLQEALLDRIDLLVARPAVLPGVEIIPDASCFSDSLVETSSGMPM